MDFENKIRIGFVILVWNSEKVIKKCLESIFNLKYISPVVVVVDNGSEDNTSALVNNYMLKYSDQLSVIHYKCNKGTTVSRNEGLKKLYRYNLDYYCILDSDTIINDDAFLLLASEMHDHPEYGIIGPKMITSSGMVQMSARCFPTMAEKFLKGVPIKKLQKIGERMELQAPMENNSKSYPVDYLMSACWLLRTELLDRVGLLDENIFYAPEDAEYCIRVWKSGFKVAYCPKAEIIHEWQRLSKKKLISKVNWEHIKGLAYMFNKHHYLLSSAKLINTFPNYK